MKPDVVYTAILPYYMRYEGNGAVVYKHTYLGTPLKIATFTYGVDAQEYVDLKNKDAAPVMVQVAAWKVAA